MTRVEKTKKTTIYDLAESSEKPKALIERMGQSIRNLFGEGNLLVDEYDAYEQLMEDFADLAAAAERREEQTISHEQLLKELKNDGLLPG